MLEKYGMNLLEYEHVPINPLTSLTVLCLATVFIDLILCKSGWIPLLIFLNIESHSEISRILLALI